MKAAYSRRLFVGLLPLTAAACGFRPVYATRGMVGAPSKLQQVSVDVIPDRSGQMLREALQQHLEGSGSGGTKSFGLAVVYTIASDLLAIQRDATGTRVRLIASAAWTLRTLELGGRVVTSGSARMVDGLNVIDQQYFAEDLENEDAQRRLADAIAGQISLQMASYFNKLAV